MRLVKMNGVDLAQFQFDYDLSWSALFLNADGTVYARYGSRSADGPMETNCAEGLAATMRRVIEAHERYPAGRDRFEAKRGPAPRHARPEAIPAMSVRAAVGGVTRGSCVHCHNVHEALDREDGARFHEKVFKYPLPESIGLVVDPASGTTVAGVLAGSPAAAAGIERGDAIVAMDRQAIFSIADIQFVLHHLPAEAELAVEIERGGEGAVRAMRLAGDWRRTDFTWRASLKGFPPDPGLYLYTLSGAEKEAAGIAAGRVGLEVRGLFDDAVRRSGLVEGDIIIAYDGRREAISAPDFHTYLRRTHFAPGSVVELEVLRGGEARRLAVRLRE